MKQVLKISLFAFVISACGGSADSKVKELAKEMCGCFDSFQTNLSADGKKLMKEVSKAEKPNDVLVAGMAKLTPQDAKAFTEQLQSLADKNATTFKCIQDFDKKHAKETTKNKSELTAKLLAEMQNNENCYTGAAIINLNPKQK